MPKANPGVKTSGTQRGSFLKSASREALNPAWLLMQQNAGVDQDMGLDKSLLSQNREGSDDIML